MYGTYQLSGRYALTGGTYALKRTVAPVEEPVSIDEARDHLRLETNLDDGKIARLIEVARDRIEAEYDRSFCTQTWRLSLDAFPPRLFRVPRSPLVSVTSLKYYDPDGVLQTLSASVYDVDTDSDPGRVVLGWGQYWPAIRYRASAVQLTYTTGYGAPSATPPRVKLAIQMLVAHWYENIELFVAGRLNPLPHSVEALLASTSSGGY